MVRFIPASELKLAYDIFGHFYSVEVASKKVIHCRSVLEIVAKDLASKKLSTLSRQLPDAVFIMMNPGSSEPLIEIKHHIRAEAIHDLPVSLVPTKPDTTQYQVMRLMHYCQWRHVRVLNLSDLRCTKSTEFFKQFKQLEQEDLFESHSIFSAKRKNELFLKLTKHDSVRVVHAWGISSELDPLIERCQSTIKCGKNSIKGLVKEGTTHRYLHPLPTLQRQKLLWVNRMVEQCRESSEE